MSQTKKRCGVIKNQMPCSSKGLQAPNSTSSRPRHKRQTPHTRPALSPSTSSTSSGANQRLKHPDADPRLGRRRQDTQACRVADAIRE